MPRLYPAGVQARARRGQRVAGSPQGPQRRFLVARTVTVGTRTGTQDRRLNGSAPVFVRGVFTAKVRHSWHAGTTTQACHAGTAAKHDRARQQLFPLWLSSSLARPVGAVYWRGSRSHSLRPHELPCGKRFQHCSGLGRIKPECVRALNKSARAIVFGTQTVTTRRKR